MVTADACAYSDCLNLVETCVDYKVQKGLLIRAVKPLLLK